MNIPSKLISKCVQEFTKLPGIGKKTALRLTLHLLSRPIAEVEEFSQTVAQMCSEIQYCTQCHNVSDAELCNICKNPARQQSLVCVVESLRDVIAIENTGQYSGVYHILGGVISPLDGIGPDQLNVESLVARASEGKIKEVIMALSATMEGDTTIFYVSKKLSAYEVKITSIARGVSFGGELEFTDELTLARSIATRMPYENYLIKK